MLFLFIMAIIVGIIGGIVEWKTSNGKVKRSRRRKKGSLGILGLIMLPLFLFDEISKGVKDMARPAYGRYGRKSIERRKRGKRRF